MQQNTMRTLSIIAVLSVVSVAISQSLPSTPNNFVATISESQTWYSSQSLISVYSIAVLDTEWIYHSSGKASSLTCKIKKVIMNQEDLRVLLCLGANLTNFGPSSLQRKNGQQIASNVMPNGQAYTSYRMKHGLLSPNEIWAFDGDTPISGSSLGIRFWIVKDFQKKLVDEDVLRFPCKNITYSPSL